MKIIISIFVIMFSIVLPLAAQSNVDSYTERFNKGEREISFMQEYISLLQQNKKTSLLEAAADAYLSQIDINERYKGDNLILFTRSVKDYNAKSFRDLMANWKRFATKENYTTMSDKVAKLYLSAILGYTVNKKQSSDEFKKKMSGDIKKIESAKREHCSLLLAIHTATEKQDIATILKITRERVSKLNKKSIEGWHEAAILGTAFNVVLENGDISQCKELLVTLKTLKNESQKNYIDTLCDNLEGRIIMSE